MTRDFSWDLKSDSGSMDLRNYPPRQSDVMRWMTALPDNDSDQDPDTSPQYPASIQSASISSPSIASAISAQPVSDAKLRSRAAWWQAAVRERDLRDLEEQYESVLPRKRRRALRLRLNDWIAQRPENFTSAIEEGTFI